MILFQIGPMRKIKKERVSIPETAVIKELVIKKMNYKEILKEIARISNSSVNYLRKIPILKDKRFVKEYGYYLVRITKATKDLTSVVFKNIPVDSFKKHPEEITMIAETVEPHYTILFFKKFPEDMFNKHPKHFVRIAKACGKRIINILDDFPKTVFAKYPENVTQIFEAVDGYTEFDVLPESLFMEYPNKITRMVKYFGDDVWYVFENMPKTAIGFEKFYEMTVGAFEKEYNIKTPGRYDLTIIEHLVKNINKRSSGKKRVLVIDPTYDAESLIEERYALIDIIYNDMDLRIIEAGSREECTDMITKMKKKYGPFDFIIIRAPFEKGKGFKLGHSERESDYIDLRNENVAKKFMPALKRGGRIVLATINIKTLKTADDIIKKIEQLLPKVVVKIPEEPSSFSQVLDEFVIKKKKDSN